MRNERGITLVALVVTIVVLLILAGVTITYALSSNGIFTKAQGAQKASEQATIRDAVSNVQAEVLIDFYNVNSGTTAKEPDFDDLLAKYLPSGWELSNDAVTRDKLTGALSGTIDIKGSYKQKVTIENGVVESFTDSTS